MAQLTSLGIHTPVALQYLVSEGLLPPNPPPQLYQWETYVTEGRHGKVEEEVLATKRCVAWSQGIFVRNIYRFDLEGDEVTQALLTNFPDAHGSRRTENPKADQFTASINGSGTVRLQKAASKTADLVPSAEAEVVHHSSRALVVFLKNKAHVQFLHGTCHIVDLPFEVARAFPAPRGLVIQRKATPSRSSPTTPTVPMVPPNSFFSSQIQPSSFVLQSPSVTKSLAGTTFGRPSSHGVKTGLDGLLNNVLGTQTEDDEDDLAGLYSLIDPLSDVGVISCSIQAQQPRFSTHSQASLNVRFEPLDVAEEILYVSPTDELASNERWRSEPLTLIVTANKDTSALTIWHAWYLSKKSLSDLLRQRAAAKTAKARRRSSFVSAGLATGATTPAMRTRDGGARESFAAGGPVPTRGDGGAPSNPTATRSSRRKTRQEEEEAMASQMDPDYEPSNSQQGVAARESRRISSLNVDIRASQHQPNASFVGAVGRRNTSFGGVNDRRSLGHRKSRGSTPGSVLNRSIGADDDSMDLDSSMDGDETVESAVRHIRATFEANGAEDIIGAAEDSFIRDIVMRKIHSLPLKSQYSSPDRRGTKAKVYTLSDLHSALDGEDRRLDIHIQDAAEQELVQVLVKYRPLFPELLHSHHVPIPIIVGHKNFGPSKDIIKLNDDSTEAILSADRGLIMSVYGGKTWPLPDSPRYRRYDPFAVSQIDQTDVDFGRNRTLQQPARVTLRLQNAGINGIYDERDECGSHHRLRMKLRPSDRFIDLLLDACKLVLPTRHSHSLLGMWCDANGKLRAQPERIVVTAESIECTAFVTTVLALAMPLVGQKTRAALRVSRIAASNSSVSAEFALSKGHHAKRWSKRTTWSSFIHQTANAEVQSSPSFNVRNQSTVREDQLLVVAATLADEMLHTERVSAIPTLEPNEIMKIMLALHIISEEQKLCILSTSSARTGFLVPLIVLLGGWLGAANWTSSLGSYYHLSMDRPWALVKADPLRQLPMTFMDEPVGVYHWFEHSLSVASAERYPTLDLIYTLDSGTLPSQELQKIAKRITPRLAVLSDLIVSTGGFCASATETVEMMDKFEITTEIMETLPEAISAPLRDAISRCEKDPPTTWPSSLLTLVGRDDLTTDGARAISTTANATSNATTTLHDVQTICHALDHPPHTARTKEAHRHAISQLIFNEDRRLVEATSLMHYNSAQVAECPKQAEWTDAQHLEQQRRVMQYVTTRMIALPAGDAMLHFDSQQILLTDKYYVTGFSNSCLMQPMGHTLTTDRSGLTEEKVNWAYFHAGASAGLRISRSVIGIDTSWIAFNKPTELTNRHAGLLLALGLTGHLRHLAKWLSFKYLTPKHSMTSAGLLLGLSASYMGTMDSLITRMLSVHITRMLPQGAAELNVSPVTQTAGLVGIGLLYYNTQHRRMSEVMLSEIEHMELEDPDAGPDPLRDESYRLAAGIALGYINLGRGKDLHGLHGMFLPERLLAVAVGPRPVSAVHVFDRATAGAVMAIMLVYMKSNDKSVARKIDIPDTEAQFDHVRPDMLMLRVTAKHLILWDAIKVKPSKPGVPSWIQAHLPLCFRDKFDEIRSSSGRHPLKSSDVPFFNVASGLAVALSLKYAGSGKADARDEILMVLDYLYMVKGGAEAHYYDAKLTRSTVRRCIDVLALAAATVMAGTGDVRTFRYLRRLHGRTDAETPYGSHLAAHLAIGALFLGGGTFTFGTSDLAIASLTCAFYPLFPMDVHDNHVHLQALRHFWVFAVEARCLVIEETDTQRPIAMPIMVTLLDGSIKSLTAPCLLPELDTIATVHTNNPAYWRVTLDFKNNPEHLLAFRKEQRIFVRRCPAFEAHNSIFSTTLAAMANVQTSSLSTQQIWCSIFELPAFKELDKSSIELILPPDVHSIVANDEKGTVVDDQLVLYNAVTSSERDALWNLRMLFAWAEKAQGQGQGQLRWLGREVVEALKAKLEQRSREV